MFRPFRTISLQSNCYILLVVIYIYNTKIKLSRLTEGKNERKKKRRKENREKNQRKMSGMQPSFLSSKDN